MLTLDRFNTNGTNVARVGRERDGYASDTVAFGGTYLVSDQFTLHATLRHVDAEIEFDPSPFPPSSPWTIEKPASAPCSACASMKPRAGGYMPWASSALHPSTTTLPTVRARAAGG